jgi:serine/threonine-protein phosphatase 5
MLKVQSETDLWALTCVGYYRLGSAEIALGKYKQALKSFKLVVKLYPQNKEAKEKLQLCEKILRKIAFEEAIEVKEIPISEEVQSLMETLEVEASYSGVRIEPTVTLENVKQMMQEFKLEKKIHVKYLSCVWQSAHETYSVDMFIKFSWISRKS